MKTGIIIGLLSLFFNSNIFGQERDILPFKMEYQIADKISSFTQFTRKDTISVFAVKIVIRPPGGLDKIVFSVGTPRRTDSLLQKEFENIGIDWSQLYDSTDATGVINIIMPVLKSFDVPSDNTTVNSLSFDKIAELYEKAFTFPIEERKWSKSSTIICKPLIIKQYGPAHH